MAFRGGGRSIASGESAREYWGWVLKRGVKKKRCFFQQMLLFFALF
jgi:hypothetical protein